MRRIDRPMFRFFLIAAVAAAVSLVIVLYSARGGAWADPPPPCADVECESSCWSDGTHYNDGTYVIQKQPTLLECGNNDGTCITKPCGHGGGH